MLNGEFNPTWSTDNIWREEDMERCLSNDLNTIEANIANLQTGKADMAHTHTEYSTASEVTALQTLVGDTSVASQISSSVATKADIDHTHSGYASLEHTHSYNDLNDKPIIPTSLPANGGNSDTVDGKHAHEFASATDVTALQALVGDTSVSAQIATQIDGKADAAHIHDDRYYTEAEVDNKLGGKAAVVHTHSVATTATAGFMSEVDKAKLNGIDTGANNYTLPTATSSVFGGVKIGSNITNSSGTISLTKSNVTSALGYTPFDSASTLSVACGGTGSNIFSQSATVTHVNVTSDSATTCTYYTYLKMCFLRSYIVLSNDMAAGNILEVLNIANAYRPPSITALSAFSTSAMISAYVRRNMTDNTAPAFVRIRSDKALPTGTAIYISGWFMSPYV